MPGPGRAATSLAIVLAGLATLAAVWVGLSARRERAHRAACGNTLRQVALAAIEYGDQQRFLPFAGDSLRARAGGVESTVAARITRSLVSEGLLLPGDGQVCSASADEVPAEGSPWLALEPEDQVSPMVERPGDPTLREARDLSYGWSRRLESSNCRCTRPLVADRAVRPRGGTRDPEGDPLQGDHVEGLNVATTDGAVSWVASDSEEAARLLGDGAQGHGGGVGIADPTDPLPARPLARRWTGLAGDALLLVPFGLAGLLLLLHAAPAPPAPASGVVPVRPSAVVALPGRASLASPARDGGAGAGVLVGPEQRCPWCHAGLAPAQPLTTCPACRTVFHAACAAPGAPCTTLGCTGGGGRPAV